MGDMMLLPKVLDKNFAAPRLFLITGYLLIGLCILGHFLADKNSLEFLSPPELIRHHGYPAEVHIVVTNDGFLLEHHRIPHGRHSNRSSGPPVILQHGFLCTSDSWVMNGGGKDLAFILADAGFDIWLTNCRATPFAHVHEAYKATQKFNDFSFHEFGQIDLSHTIDYILSATGYGNVSFVGHSMGTLMLSVLLSTKPEYNAKVNYFVAIAPVWKRTPFVQPSHRLIEGFWYIMGPYFEILDEVNVFQRNTLRQYLSYFFYGNNPVGDVFKFGVNMFMRQVGGTNTTRHSSIPESLLVSKIPSGLVHFTLKHYHELIDYDEFRMRDFGPDGNIAKYNSTSPPLYDTNQIKVPTTIYHSNEDVAADTKTVHWVASQLQNLEKIVNLQGFNHFDIVWSDDASEVFFYDILDTLERVNNISDCLVSF